MNLINPGGLLWFDDDNRRPIQQKIAEAAQRFRERVGLEPTVCQLNPAQATALEASAAQGATRTKRASSHPTPALPALPESLKLVPSELIQPHCYLLGIAEGEQPRAAALPYRDDEEGSPPSTRSSGSSKRQREPVSVLTPQHAATATRQARKSMRKVHAVQPVLLVEPESMTKEAPSRGGREKAPRSAPISPVASTGSKRVKRNSPAATPIPPAPKANAPKANAPKANAPKAKTPAAKVPVSLLAAAPAKTAAKTAAKTTAKTTAKTAAKTTAKTLSIPDNTAKRAEASKQAALSASTRPASTPRKPAAKSPARAQSLKPMQIASATKATHKVEHRKVDRKVSQAAMDRARAPRTRKRSA